jgi:hypothetical protein
MSPDPRTGGLSELGDAATDPITSLLDGIADSCAHAVSGLQRGVQGTYPVSDVFADVMECSIRASRLGVALLRGFGLLPPATAPQRNPDKVMVDVSVDPAGAAKLTAALTASTLVVGELRAIGFGELFKVPADKVGVGPPTRQRNGLTTVRVAVDFADVSTFERDHTIIYEGTITVPPSATGAPTTYRVRVPKPAH